MKRWFQVYTNNSIFGFSINEENIVVDCAPIGQKYLMGRSVKDPDVRKWFTQNKYQVVEIKTDKSINENSCTK